VEKKKGKRVNNVFITVLIKKEIKTFFFRNKEIKTLKTPSNFHIY